MFCGRLGTKKDQILCPDLLLQVALLQETVRRECEEREGLTAALSQAREELLRVRSSAFHRGSCSSATDSMERPPLQGYKRLNLQIQSHVPLSRSSNSPNVLRPPPASRGNDRGWCTDGRGMKSVESWNHVRALGGEKRREGTLPRLTASGAASDVKRRVSPVTD